MLKLLRAILRAGVMEAGLVAASGDRNPARGSDQSRCCATCTCTGWTGHGTPATFGVLVRFADDLLVMCKSRQQAEAALARLRQLLAELGLEPKEAKTRIVQLAEGGEGFDFLGFHHRMVRSRGVRGRRGVEFLARWPSDKAMQRARDRIRN